MFCDFVVIVYIISIVTAHVHAQKSGKLAIEFTAFLYVAVRGKSKTTPNGPKTKRNNDFVPCRRILSDTSETKASFIAVESNSTTENDFVHCRRIESDN